MRWLAGLMMFLLALGTLRLAGCGDDARVPCDPSLYGKDCPESDDECLYLGGCFDGFCRYQTSVSGRGCVLSDGSLGVCRHDGCVASSEAIRCTHGSSSLYDWPDGTLCRQENGREGTCLDGVCGGDDFCDEVTCEDENPDDLCQQDPYCTWEGGCQYAVDVRCGWQCEDAECDPATGRCVTTSIWPDGADCWGFCFDGQHSECRNGDCTCVD